jgi:cell division protein FtsB
MSDPDAGLVERLRACARTDGKAPIHLLISAADALEAKDEEIEDADHLADLQQKEIERLRATIEAKDAEIEYWQNGYADALMQRNTADDTIEAQAREIEALTQINETLLADEKLAQSYIDLREARAEIERLREVLRLTRCRTKGEKP